LLDQEVRIRHDHVLQQQRRQRSTDALDLPELSVRIRDEDQLLLKRRATALAPGYGMKTAFRVPYGDIVTI